MSADRKITRRSFAGAAALAGDRDTADDAEIEQWQILELDLLAMLDIALRGGGKLEADALAGELFRIDAQIGEALGQVRHRRQQQLAFVQRPQTHRNLRRIGIAFDRFGALPGVELRQALGGDVGADEIGDARRSQGRSYCELEKRQAPVFCEFCRHLQPVRWRFYSVLSPAYAPARAD